MCTPTTRISKIWIFTTLIIHLASPSFGFYEKSAHVITLNHADIHKLQNDITDDVWMVQFYKSSQEDMHNTSRAFETTAKSITGYAKVGALDLEKHPLITLTMELSEFPSYGFYGYYKYLPDIFTHFDRIKGIQDEITKQMGYVFEERSIFRFIDSKRNYELGTTDMGYRVISSKMPWGIIYYNPECKKSLKAGDDWKILANNFKEVIQFGSVNNPLYQILPGENLEYPKIQFYPEGEKEGAVPDNYTGEVNYFPLYEYFKGKIPEPKAQRLIDIKSGMPCLNKFYCILTFLPKTDHCSKECVVRNLFSLNSAAKEYKLQSVYWLWNIFDEQPGVEKVFDLDKCNHPVVVFLNLQIGKFAKVDTDAVNIDIIKKVMDRRDDEAAFPYDLPVVAVPEIKVLEECKRDWIKDEL